MNFVDAALIQLANPATRAAFFDQVALEQIFRAAYDEPLAEGPFNAVFDTLELGYALPQPTAIQGSWYPVGTNMMHEATFAVSGLGETRRVTAFWRGGIVARSTPAQDRIVEVQSGWATALGSLDELIRADLGALPDDPVVLENARRDRLQAALAGFVSDPDSLSDPALDRWLTALGVGSVGELLARYQAGAVTSALRLRFAEPLNQPPTPHLYPLTAAILIRDVGFSLSDLLIESKEILARLSASGDQHPTPSEYHERHSIVITWIIPQAVFNDDAWPGAAAGMSEAQRRVARRRAAGEWLGQEGIGLVVH